MGSMTKLKQYYGADGGRNCSEVYSFNTPYLINPKFAYHFEKKNNSELVAISAGSTCAENTCVTHWRTQFYFTQELFAEKFHI
jgi:hypothetical protein